MATRVLLLFFLLLLQNSVLAGTTYTTDAIQAIDSYQQLNLSTASSSEVDRIISSVWHIRIPNDSSGELQTFDFATFRSAQPAVRNLNPFTLSNIHFSHSRVAIARMELLSETLTALLVLFKEDNAWKVVSDLRTSKVCLTKVKKYGERGQHGQVITVLGKYYDAVRFETSPMLHDVFHKDWYMKNHQGTKAVFEGVESFKKYLTGDKHKTYYNTREIADVQVIYDCMAFIRIDSTKSGGNTFFAFYKQDGDWLMTDKIWTVPLK